MNDVFFVVLHVGVDLVFVESSSSSGGSTGGGAFF